MAKHISRSAFDPKTLDLLPRAEVPVDELTKEEAELWRSIINSMPADHFQDANLHMLVKLCKHVTTGRKLDQMVETETSKRQPDDKRLFKLLKSRKDETLAINVLTRSMRLTQQSVSPLTAARRIKGVTASKLSMLQAPWSQEPSEDEDGSGEE